jgi:hypothetical protein
MKIFLITLILFLAACSGGKDGDTTDLPPTDTYLPEFISAPHRTGFVDERYELVSLAFRLAGAVPFNDTDTAYQRGLNETFGGFRGHPLVTFIHGLGFSQDAVFRMAVHLNKEADGFELVGDIGFLVQQDGGMVRWTETNAAAFVALLNDFYADTGFAAFFGANADFYLASSERFYNQVYNKVNHAWFAAHGVNPDNLRTVLSPAATMMGFAAGVYGETPEDTVVYAKIPYAADFSGFLWLIIHEYAHAAANPIADEWYTENAEFRRWSDESVDSVRRPGHAVGFIMAREYVTESFEALYMIENEWANPVLLLYGKMNSGLPYIAEVFALLTDTEPLDLHENILAIVLGSDYVVTETVHSFQLGNQTVMWRFVDTRGHAIPIDNLTFSTFGNVLATSTGDAIVIGINGAAAVWVDIGSGEGIGGRDASFRQYTIFPLSEPLSAYF